MSVEISSLINSFFGIFLQTVMITVAKINCVGLKETRSPFPRELLIVSDNLCYRHIHVGVCGGEQVGEALPCPCSNLLDLNQWQLGRGTVPQPSQVTPYPDLDSDEPGPKDPGDCSLSQGCCTSSCCVSELMLLSVSLCGQDKTRPVRSVTLFQPIR